VGFALQSFAPPAQPYAVSSADALLSLDQQHTRHTNRAPEQARAHSPYKRRGYDASPAFRALLHARVRHLESGGLGRPEARSSPGILPLQGAPPHPNGLAFTGPPLTRLIPPSAEATDGTPSQGVTCGRGWLVSRETADPPGVLRLVTDTFVRVGRGPGVTSSGIEVRHRPLSSRL
jgi:hypothetical protein